jgi:hypothetical protein
VAIVRRHAEGHHRSFGDSGAAVVQGRVGGLHARQFADHRLKLVDRLQDALADLGLVRRVRGDELRPARESGHDGRNGVIVDPAAEEGGPRSRGAVPVRQRRKVPENLDLGLGRRKIERPRKPETFGDRAEEILDAGNADRRQHRLDVVLCVGNVGHQRNLGEWVNR